MNRKTDPIIGSAIVIMANPGLVISTGKMTSSDGDGAHDYLTLTLSFNVSENEGRKVIIAFDGVEQVDRLIDALQQIRSELHPVEERYTPAEYADLVKPPDQFVE